VLTGPWIVTVNDVTVLSTWMGSCTCPMSPILIARVTCTHYSVHHSLDVIVKYTAFIVLCSYLTVGTAFLGFYIPERIKSVDKICVE
jgi:hypothetical protein